MHNTYQSVKWSWWRFSWYKIRIKAQYFAQQSEKQICEQIQGMCTEIWNTVLALAVVTF